MPATKKTATKSTPAKKAGPQDAVQLLMADHKEVKALFQQYKTLAEGGAEGSERQALAETICDMLTVHATIEEEIFYPAARSAMNEEDLLDEAEVEHASAKDLIAQIKDMAPDDDLYDAKVKVLGEYVNHHVQEEETEMFPKAKQADMGLVALGEELLDRKAELMSDLGESAES